MMCRARHNVNLFALVAPLLLVLVTQSATAQDLGALMTEFKGHYDAGRYSHAEQTARRALRYAEQQRNETSIAVWSNQLGLTLKELGRPAEAEPLILRGLRTAERLRGPNDSAVATFLSNLADVYSAQGKYAQAEPLHQRALRIRERTRGPEHLDVAISLNNLGLLYREWGKYAQAEPLLRRSLGVLEKALGPEHRHVATSLNNLAALYESQGKYAEAAPPYQRSLAIQEKKLGPHHPDLASTLNNLALLYTYQGKHAEAEPLCRRALRIGEKSLGPDHPDVARTLNNLALLYNNQGKYDESEPLYQRALGILEKSLGADHSEVATCITNLADICARQARYAEAVSLYQRALRIQERALGANHPYVASTTSNLARLYADQAKYADAEPLYRQAMRIWEKALGPDHPEVATGLNNLASLHQAQAQYAEAESLYRKSLRISETSLGPDHPDVANRLNNLAELYRAQGKYAEAESLHQRALRIREKAFGPDHPEVANSLNNLAILYYEQRNAIEAEPLHQRALRISEKAFGPHHPDVALSLHNLAGVYRDQGKYAEAEPLYQRALRIREKAIGPNHPEVAHTLNNLASIYDTQGKHAEAESLYQQALRIREKMLGPDHPEVANSLSNLATFYHNQGKYAEAERLHQRALGIREQVLGPDHVDVAWSLSGLAWVWRDLGKSSNAESFYQRALRIREQSLGPDHPDVAWSLSDLAYLYRKQERLSEAEPLIDRAIRIRERAGVAPGTRFHNYLFRAQLSWDLGRPGEAIDDLEEAMRLAEEQRVQASGGARDRARAFAEFASAFEQMLQWQCELGDVSDAVNAIERSRARTLLDDMLQSGSDLHAGRSLLEREQLQQQESALRQQIAMLEKELQRLDRTEPDFAATEQKLAAARTALYEYDRQMRLSSPVYRNLLSVGSGPPALGRLQRQLLQENDLLLLYLIGEKCSYVVILTADNAKLARLTVNELAAEALQITPGPLTAEQLHEALMSEQGTGLLQRLANPDTLAETTAALSALWQTLIPEDVRAPLREGTYQRLIVVPDGPLALLPFETLVVEGGEEPKYLLDAGPPILYGPSATVLYNLAIRSPAANVSAAEPVLTIGDPRYAADVLASRGEGVLDELTPRSRYGAVGGELTPLPYSGWETSWLHTVFSQQGLAVAQLTKAEATEARVRDAVAGRRIVHLACHGLVDQEYGNFFGALALSPGDHSNPDNDGFLTLPEIYELDLAGCELAILSACQTNYGPQQRGEGMWALSRGFLVAGARRVVASNWLVDDEAAASMMSIFCSRLARQQAEGVTPDHAEALHAAKRWARSQQKWSSPYYWGTFVLVGPE